LEKEKLLQLGATAPPSQQSPQLQDPKCDHGSVVHCRRLHPITAPHRLSAAGDPWPS
ncbi:hypothetical protein ACJ72_03902, partial [Emergomyces africanus]